MAHLSKNNLTRFQSSILPRRPPSAFGQARVRGREGSIPGQFPLYPLYPKAHLRCGDDRTARAPLAVGNWKKQSLRALASMVRREGSQAEELIMMPPR